MVANGIGPRVEEMETVINYQIKASKAEAESTAGCITNRAALFDLFGFDSKRLPDQNFPNVGHMLATCWPDFDNLLIHHILSDFFMH